MKKLKYLFTHKTASLTWFFILMFLEMVFANLAHPATPFLIEQRGFPAYTFGFAFSAMAFTNFLFSPFWGLMSNRYGRMKVYLIGCLGYALGQLTFALAMTFWMVIVARMISGFFVGAVMVMHLTVVMDYSSQDSMASNLTIHATVFTISGAVGYLVGGFLGDVSLTLMFTAQIIGLAFSGILAYMTFLQIPISKDELLKKHNWVKEINPISSFIVAKKYVKGIVWVFLLVVFFAQVGSIAFDQAFNFFIRDQFKFLPSYNGILKAGFGVLSLVINSTIGIYLVRKTGQQRPLSWVLFFMGILSNVLFVLYNQTLFIVVAISLFVLNSIYLILVQTIAGTLGRKIDHSLFMGLFNAIKSFGMIIGSSMVGLVYSVSAYGSFIFSGVFFLLAAILLVYFSYASKKGRLT